MKRLKKQKFCQFLPSEVIIKNPSVTRRTFFEECCLSKENENKIFLISAPPNRMIKVTISQDTHALILSTSSYI